MSSRSRTAWSTPASASRRLTANPAAPAPTTTHWVSTPPRCQTRRMLQTWLTERFGITVPVVSAPMGGAAEGRFAAAVSAAGGLGMVAVGSDPADWIRREADVAAVASSSYGIGLLAWLL